MSLISTAQVTTRRLHYAVMPRRRDTYCPRMLSWRRTSKGELEETDRKILDALPCVKERKFVKAGENQLWSVICNPDNTGTPVMMVHGMGGGVGLWTMNLDAISKDRPVYAFDMLGFGRSSHPSFSSNPEEAETMFVDAIESYRKEMNLDKFILLGHSLGGYLSASYSLRFPQHVKHLIMVDPWGMDRRPPEGVRRELPVLMKLVLPLISSFNPMTMLRVIGPLGPVLVKKYRPGLAETFSQKFGDPQLFHDYIYHCNAQDPSGEIGFKSMTVNIGWAKNPMLERMVDLDPSIPVTFIFGAKSWVDRNTGWKLKNTRESYVDVQILREAGHHVYADRYNVFNKLVESIACSVDQDLLPDLDNMLVKRIHAAPSMPSFYHPAPDDPDFERPFGHPNENTEDDDCGDVGDQGDSDEREQRPVFFGGDSGEAKTQSVVD